MPETSALDSDAFELAPDTILSPGTAGGALGPQGDVAYRTTPSVPTASRACPGIFLQVHTDLAAIEGEWRALEAKADLTAFQCFDWAAKWQKHIGARNDTQPAIILGRDAEGEPLFVLPLAIERRWLARRLTWLGSELCDYNGPLLSKLLLQHFRAANFVALWHEILLMLHKGSKLRFDLVDLPKMTAEVGGQPNPFMALNPTLDPSGAHLANLGASWDAFYAAKRSASTRKRERRQFKNLGNYGDVRFVEPTGRREVEETLEALFAQKGASLARMGVENFLARPGYKEFFRDIATDPEAKSFTHVSRLDVGTTMAGTSFGLEFRGRYYLLLSSYQDGELSRFGPGRAHLQELLRRAIGKGMTQFDFTVGDEPYKRDWSDVTLPLYGHFAATTPLGLPAVGATLAFRVAKRTIKQNPLLWRIFNDARQRIAAWKRRPAGPVASSASDD
jgi:CelD/BcsL family acetyltransferase involved in cellulose biosynthesis